jgi:hypothetical protein
MMATDTLASRAEAAIWERVIHFEMELSPTAARALLKVRFSPNDLERMAELAAKARAGALTPDEERETDAYERLGCLLDILHSQARRALKRRRKAS